ncbi:hypothetical protein [Xanthobacter oligotrophicus]|uniref:hypothetical protein n=1 Tax=Xanthobacter oligotrophicus TaxID=2607286 RepID=UPI0011F17325|nr:hypothetical protein [Xanthobacter oligotrophicus]MCG5237112.1 hypothetical protein [Xanthobacter oligotrophicus]
MTETLALAAATANLNACPADRLNAGLDLLLTAYVAMNATGWLDEEAMNAIRHTVDRGIECLRPLRVVLEDMQSAG